MNKDTKKVIFFIGVLTLGATIYALYKGKNDYMTYFGGLLGLTLAVLPFVTRSEQRK